MEGIVTLSIPWILALEDRVALVAALLTELGEVKTCLNACQGATPRINVGKCYDLQS